MGAVSPTVSRSTQLRIQDPRLLAAVRVIWMALIALSLVTVLLGLPLTYADRLDQADQLFAESMRQIGMAHEFYAHYFGSLQVLYVLVSLIVAVVLFWKRSDDFVALLASAMMVTFSVTVSPLTNNLADAQPAWTWVVIALESISKLLLILTLMVFPDGLFLPAWVRWLLIPAAVTAFGASFFEVTRTATSTLPLFTLLFGAWVLAGLFLQINRYRRFSTPAARQQTKWVLYGMAVAIIPALLFAIVDSLITPWLIERPLIRLFYRFIANTFLIYIPLSLLPISIGVAALRYRLWDIDLAINRSLAYGGTLALLGAAALGVGFALQSVVGAGNVVVSAVIFSLPAIAAGVLFRPARHRIQQFVDHQLYGLRFDLDAVALAERTQPLPKMGELSGQTLGGCTVHDVIGQGGMGKIYRGYDPTRQLTLAIKTLTDVDNDEARVRFEREARVVAALRHTNIVRVYDYDVASDIAYMTMEYVEGIDLRAFIQRQAPIASPIAASIITEVASALDYVHAQGIVHRDIKPSNIRLRLDEKGHIIQVMLMDFGIAKMNDTNVMLTSTNALGTIDYMSPEQIKMAAEVDHRADIYALGVVLYEMLTGRRPFGGSGPQVLFAHLQQPPANPRTLVPTIPHETAHAILRALSKDADDRYSSAGEFAASLK